MNREKLLPLFIISFSIPFAIITISPWLSSECQMTTHGDLEDHFTMSYLIRKQLKENLTIYPITFELNPMGHYQYLYSAFPYLLPLLIEPLFSNPRSSFLIFYAISYAFVPFSLFFLLKKITKNVKASLIFSMFFLISPSLNQQFTVHGSYHTIVALNFFFLGFYFLISYCDDSSIKNLIGFVIFTFLCGITHIFTFVFYFLVSFTYLILKRNFKGILLLLLSTFAASFYYIPLIIESTLISKITRSNPPILNFFELLSLGFLKFYTKYVPEMDYNYGPYLLILTLISLAMNLSIKRKRGTLTFALKRDIHLFPIVFFSIMLLYMLLYQIEIIAKFTVLDRLLFYAQISFLIFACYGFSRLKENKIFFIIILITLSLLSKNLIRMLTVSFFIIFTLIFISRKFVKPKFKRDYILSSFFIFFTFLPVTGIVPSSIYNPRIWCTYVPNINEFILPNDTYLAFSESPSAFFYNTGAKTANIIIYGRETHRGTIELKTPESFKKLKKMGVSKIIIERFFFPDYEFLKKYFNYTEIKGITRGMFLDVFDIYSTSFKRTENYTAEFISPIEINITKKNPNEENVTILIYYHPLWKVSNNLEIQSDEDGLILITNSSGIESFKIWFDTKYFNIGFFISITSFIILTYLIFRKSRMSKNGN